MEWNKFIPYDLGRWDFYLNFVTCKADDDLDQSQVEPIFVRPAGVSLLGKEGG